MCQPGTQNAEWESIIQQIQANALTNTGAGPSQNLRILMEGSQHPLPASAQHGFNLGANVNEAETNNGLNAGGVITRSLPSVLPSSSSGLDLAKTLLSYSQQQQQQLPPSLNTK
jgi:hypothetical protein